MEKNTPLLISVTGWSGSGKTSFCERLIAELISRGYETAAVKNTHEELQIDKPGSDSSRFFSSGAGAVCLNTGNSMTVFYQRRLQSGNELTALFSDYVFIVAEGFKDGASLRVEVTGMLSEPKGMKNPPSGADIIIYGNTDLAERLRSAMPREGAALLLHRDDIRGAADLICSRLEIQPRLT